MKKFIVPVILVMLLVLAAPILAQDADDDDSDYFCDNPTELHPALVKVADRFDVPYEEILGIFCTGKGDETGEGIGVGQIVLAYQTRKALNLDMSAADIISQKQALGGWGDVWKEFGFSRKPGKADKQDKANKPDAAGEKDNGGGRYAGAGEIIENGENENTITSPEGQIYIKALVKCGPDVFTYTEDTNDGCLDVQGLGTSTVIINRIGDGKSCKDIGAIALYYEE